jgi:hypothetical protein
MPGTANPNVLDFNKLDALKLFNKAIAALDTKFDLEEEKLRTFLEQVRDSSLTDKAKLQMLSEKDKYCIGDVPSGVCFLKAIIGRSSIDSTAKVGMLRKKIANRPIVIMEEHKGNIRTFNIYVAKQREQLLGRGKGVEELSTFLFDAYLKVPDEEFRRYIEVYRDRNDEGTPIDDETLMRVALNKYEVIQHRKSKST